MTQPIFLRPTKKHARLKSSLLKVAQRRKVSLNKLCLAVLQHFVDQCEAKEQGTQDEPPKS